MVISVTNMCPQKELRSALDSRSLVNVYDNEAFSSHFS